MANSYGHNTFKQKVMGTNRTNLVYLLRNASNIIIIIIIIKNIIILYFMLYNYY